MHIYLLPKDILFEDYIYIKGGGAYQMQNRVYKDKEEGS